MIDYFSNTTKEFKNIQGSNPVEPALLATAHATAEQKERSKKIIKENEEYVAYDDKDKLTSISEEINHRSAAIKCHIFEIGRLLCEAKKHLKHGAFKGWIEDNLPFSYETSVNIKRVYTHCMGVPEMIEYYSPSHLYEICSPKFPGELREHLFENAAHGGFIEATKTELIKTALKFRDGGIDLHSPELQNMLKNRYKKIEIEECKIEMKEIINFLKNRIKKIHAIESDCYVNNPLIDKITIRKSEDSPKKQCEIKIGTLIMELEVLLKDELEKM